MLLCDARACVYIYAYYGVNMYFMPSVVTISTSCGFEWWPWWAQNIYWWGMGVCIYIWCVYMMHAYMQARTYTRAHNKHTGAYELMMGSVGGVVVMGCGWYGGRVEVECACCMRLCMRTRNLIIYERATSDGMRIGGWRE